MKLKKWLQEYCHMTYAEYRVLPEVERYSLEGDHQRFCRNERIHESQGWQPMTDDEKVAVDEIAEKEKLRYEASHKIGGIDEKGNYTALHHRG